MNEEPKYDVNDTTRNTKFSNSPEYDVDEKVWVIDTNGRMSIIGTKITEIIVYTEGKPKYSVVYSDNIYYDEKDLYPTFERARDAARDWANG